MNAICLPRGSKPARVCLLGATGTIGRATLRMLVQRGYEVVCFGRPRPDPAISAESYEFRLVNMRDVASISRDGFRGELFDAIISCMASRSGAQKDAWAIDHQAHIDVLAAAEGAGVRHFVLLSAICVQKPLLGFQHAKLAFEAALIKAGLRYSIVRPTAFFKSLSGQVDRVKRGKPFLVFRDGTLTACKPISDDDLANYIVDCLENDQRWNRVLPIGGPGEAITPRQQGEALFTLLGRKPQFRQVPLALLDGAVALLSAAGYLVPSLSEKAELARIGRYYATESMLLLNQEMGQYDAAATPSTGTETLFSFYQKLVDGTAVPERGDHAVFRASDIISINLYSLNPVSVRILPQARG